MKLERRLRRAGIRIAVQCAIPFARVLRKAQAVIDRERMEQQADLLSSRGLDVHMDASAVITDPRAVQIGNNVDIGANTYIMSEGGLRIGDNTRISRGVTIYCSEHDYRFGDLLPHGQREWRQVTIGENVWIGPNACILPGVTIGDGAVIGMGAVVDKDVPSLAIVGARSFHVVGKRSQAQYTDAVKGAHFAGRDGEALPPERVRAFLPKGRCLAPKICFVVTTGRSGSMTVADDLSAHPRLRARHEPRQQLVRWSTEYAHGTIGRQQMRQLLSELFLDWSTYEPDRIHVESDQKYFNLIPVLKEVLPDAKFIWLTRSALDVVSSTVGRGWYAGPSHPTWHDIPWYLHQYRLHGDKAGAMSPEEWHAMSPFEKNCWYWGYVNAVIERDLSKIAHEDKMLVRIESFDIARDDIFRFLGVEPIEADSVVRNKAFYGRHVPKDWSDEERMAYDRWCGPMMARLYRDGVEPGEHVQGGPLRAFR